MVGYYCDGAVDERACLFQTMDYCQCLKLQRPVLGLGWLQTTAVERQRSQTFRSLLQQHASDAACRSIAAENEWTSSDWLDERLGIDNRFDNICKDLLVLVAPVEYSAGLGQVPEWCSLACDVWKKACKPLDQP